jgi:hypothetical protein
MRRLLLVLTIAAVMLAMTAAPTFAQVELGDIPPPGDETPGNAQPPKTDVTNPTDLHGNNWIGASASNFNKGPGGNPGSAAQPTTFGDPAEPSFNGPVTSRIGTLDPVPVNEGGSGFFVGSEKPNTISALQEFTRCNPPEGFDAPASCPPPESSG